MHAKGWQEFVNHLAAQAQKEDYRRRREAAIGNVLWTVMFCAVIACIVGLVMQSLGLIQ
jgi:hypothetical protein